MFVPISVQLADNVLTMLKLLSTEKKMYLFFFFNVFHYVGLHGRVTAKRVTVQNKIGVVYHCSYVEPT